jgi:hypothetical protein
MVKQGDFQKILGTTREGIAEEALMRVEKSVLNVARAGRNLWAAAPPVGQRGQQPKLKDLGWGWPGVRG